MKFARVSWASRGIALVVVAQRREDRVVGRLLVEACRRDGRHVGADALGDRRALQHPVPPDLPGELLALEALEATFEVRSRAAAQRHRLSDRVLTVRLGELGLG